ncbi:hypothetical protein RJT34_14746 [Clitoria ternatea]|uniref:RING-type domain-containing protein n=1 Tax=Clitoria ternatea TaxID=43366 RepID=A0AAN9PMX8_CLITE
MASSQVEIASSSPFGYVLRDRNHRDGCREGNVKATHAAFQRNIKNFVMDHLNTCMSMSSDPTTNENNNNNNNSSSVQNNDSINGSWASKAPRIKKGNLERLHLERANHVINNNKDETSLASLISPRHSRLLDRWAARQARDMVSNLENEAKLLSMDNNDNGNKNNDNKVLISRTSSSMSDESPSGTSKLVASSLVQMWEKRLNQTNGSKSNTSVEKTNPGAAATATCCNNENAFAVEEQCLDGAPLNDDSFPDWESDRTAHSDQRRFSSESDRVSVVDIIKKLTATNQNQGPPSYCGDENEQERCNGGGGSSVTSSPRREHESVGGGGGGLTTQQEHPEQKVPRIRGRQALNNLLMQLENDKHGELKNLAERGAVSKFPQRGRIQSLLRLRLLQRSVAANESSHQKSTASEVNRQPQGSAIMQLREKFSSGTELKIKDQVDKANPRSPKKEIVNNNNSTQLENSPATNQISKETSSKTAQPTESTQKSVSQTTVDHSREEAHPSSDVINQETCFQAQHYDSQEPAEATTSMTDSNPNEATTDRVETSNEQNDMAKSSYDVTVNEEEASNQQYAEPSYEEISNQNYAENCYDETEEAEEINQINDETNYDWISEISRPRSYWEQLRQAWYGEMLNTDSHNEDIRKLLERRTVSTFLSSGFREKMDRLMESHRGTRTHLVNRQVDEVDNQRLVAFLQEQRLSTRTQEDGGERREEEENEEEEEEEEEEEDKEEEEEENVNEHEGESMTGGSYHEVGDYSNQSSSWSYRDNEAADDFDRVVSTFSQPDQSQSFDRDSRRYSSSTNHHSIEMDLIYDLRGHMEQLYHEMSELRKSIKGCMDVQMQLQQSMNQEVHTVKKEEKKSYKRAPKKGNCCRICHDKKVDSVLYRCGHMCACLECANELQWNSGKCPICLAKIVDVVRVYVDG